MRMTLDIVAEGTLMNKIYDEAYALYEDVT